ncbi:MAG: cytochrome c oxidase subunit II [Burkholderiales bacterium]
MLEHLWFPHDISTFGPSIDWLFIIIFWITGLTFLAVFFAQISFMWLYRARPGHKARYIEGNRNLEIVWTTATAIIMVVLALMSNSTWAEVKEHGPPGDVFYKVAGKQFNWEITYPGPDGKLGTADDFVMDNDLHIPVNKVVRIDLESKDVIHSFFVPNMRLKQDAVPGRTIHVWFVAKETGNYEIPCAELCGFGHSGMLGTLIVQSDAEYQQWMKERASGG